MQPSVVLGIDFGGSKIATAVADTSGNRLGSATIQTRVEDSAQQTFDLGIRAARELLDRAAPGQPLVAVGACTFGIPYDDHVDLAPTITGWGDLAFGRELRIAFAGAEVRMATDVKAAAEAEARWGALLGCDPGIYLNLGTGLATAIVIDGRVVVGHHGASGEIGYNLRERGVDVRDGRRVLEDALGGKGLGTSAPQGLDSAADVFAAASHDPRAATLLAEFVTELCFHLVNLTIAIDPARIAVGGGMVRSWDQLVEPLRAALDARVPFPPELVRAEFPYDAPLVGALALGQQAANDTLREGATA